MNGWTWPIFTIAAVIVIIVLLVGGAWAAPVTIKDGDTIKIGDTVYRLHGVDAPESDQPYGKEAKACLAAEVGKAGDKLRIVKAQEKPDRYGRVIAIAYNGRYSINAAIVEQGCAWAYVDYSKAYIGHQRRAYEAQRGLWTGPRWIEPSLWRQGYR